MRRTVEGGLAEHQGLDFWLICLATLSCRTVQGVGLPSTCLSGNSQLPNSWGRDWPNSGGGACRTPRVGFQAHLSGNSQLPNGSGEVAEHISFAWQLGCRTIEAGPKEEMRGFPTEKNPDKSLNVRGKVAQHRSFALAAQLPNGYWKGCWKNHSSTNIQWNVFCWTLWALQAEQLINHHQCLSAWPCISG